MNKNNLGIISENNCSGCGACFQKCPLQCIQMEENQRGFLIPKIDNKRCASCGICTSICPERNTTDEKKIIGTLAVACKDANQLIASTSGGVFGLLAEQVLMNGGVVFGCAWNDKLEAMHRGITSMHELSEIQRSKYVQSNTMKTFQEVKKYINDGEPVLYSGTGCQIAGLYRYFGRVPELLTTVEVACHGVPSPGLFREYLKWKQHRVKGDIIDFTFRNKIKHKKGEHHTFFIMNSMNKKKFYYSNRDPYYASFLNGKTLRETCYHCKYKNNGHVGDILLSDYWGIEKIHNSFDAQYGASAVMICSEKGKSLFYSIPNEKIFMISGSYENVVANNSSLIRSSSTENKVNYTLADNRLFDILAPKISIKQILKNYVPEKIKYGLIKKFR